MRAFCRFSSSLVFAVFSVFVAIDFPLALFAQGASSSPSVAVALRPLITQPVDESQLTVLKGNTHRLARPEFDLATAPATLPMQRMLLVLKRSPDQESALRKLLDDQQDKGSPSYHKWLTPEQFGQLFGPTDSDMQTITAWLQSHGFQVGSTKGRTVLEFSGSASQVKEAFHTSIHKYLVNGEQHWANSSDPSIPTALTPAVAGVLTLHNFLSKPQSHLVESAVLAQVVQGKGNKPHVTFPAQNGQPAFNALEPQDYAVIYNINPAYQTLSGIGATIGVVGRNDLYNGGADVQDFRNEIGAGNGSFGGDNLNIIVDGPDPGDSGGDEELEATLDATWSGAIAPNANIDFVVSGSTNTTDGIDLSELYIVENNLADIMTESFGTCEYFATDARLTGINAVAEQAAAQGITYFVSTGDSGAEGCDDPSNPPATGPVSVNALASTPFNIAVGGTMFNENGDPSKYWASTAPLSETALSYIPEDAWNESSPSNGLWSGSGGASAGNFGDNQISPPGTTSGVPKPSWQTGTGLNIPADGARDLPDVSLTAAGHDFYLLCLEGSCIPDSQGYIYLAGVSGTSAAAPSFAGIMALAEQSAGGRPGQANYVLYPLAAAQAAQNIYPSQCNGSNTSTPPASTCIFNDVTIGNNVVPGEVGSDYQAGAGYDLTTGLGSVNVANLITNWNSTIFNATTTTLSLGSTTNITHGTPVNVTITVAPSSGTGTPTGNVSLLAENGPIDCFGLTAATDGGKLTAGSVSFSTIALPGGGPYCVWAHYSGDATYGPSNSNSSMVTVKPETSTTTLSLQGSSLSGNSLTSPFPFGSLVFVRADVASATHSTTVCQSPSYADCPTGTVNFADAFGSIPATNPQVSPPVQVVSSPALNSQGNTSIGDGIISFDAGNHSISASYSGDPSFTTSSSNSPVTFTIQPGFTAVSGLAPVSISAPGGTGSTTVGIIASTGFTTAITFTCSGLPAETTCSSSPATGQGPTTVVTTSITVTTTAAHITMLRTKQRTYFLATLFAGALPLGGMFLLSSSRRRRWILMLGLMMLLAMLVTIPACGGGGSGGGGGSQEKQDPGTPAGTSTVTVTATAGSLSEQGSFVLTVR